MFPDVNGGEILGRSVERNPLTEETRRASAKALSSRQFRQVIAPGTGVVIGVAG